MNSSSSSRRPLWSIPGSATKPRAPAARAGHGTRQKVLVVDDNEDAANMLQTALEQLGYVVDVTFDGLSALARAASFQPATVLLDIGLAGHGRV